MDLNWTHSSTYTPMLLLPKSSHGTFSATPEYFQKPPLQSVPRRGNQCSGFHNRFALPFLKLYMKGVIEYCTLVYGTFTANDFEICPWCCHQ